VNVVRFRRESRVVAIASAAALILVAAACSNSSSGANPGASAGSLKAAPVKTGGSITVLEGQGYSGDWPYGLDPATDLDAPANQDFLEAVYGQLFELGPGGKIDPDLATGYTMSPDAKTVTITLRQGVKFSDGTPFNAAAVLWNWNRDMGPVAIKEGIELPWELARTNPKNPASPPVSGALKAIGPYTIQVSQDQPNAAFIDQLFDSIAMWIVSPTAVQKEPEKQFAQYPVGAGPFTVVSDTYSNQLVVKRNPDYWDTGKPYLNQITFKTVGGDEEAYEAMLSGQGQVYPDMSTTALLTEAAQHLQVLNQLGTSPYDLQLNTAVPPFNNIKARQAIYAATNFAPILAHIFGNRYPVAEGFTGPGGICYEQHVPGYQGYDPALAKQLVKQSGLGSVTINLGTLNSSPVAVETTEALRTEWAQVGINATIQSYNLNGLVQAFMKNRGQWWQSMIQTAGSYDPAASVGVDFRFLSTGLASGVHDPNLDKLLIAAQSSPVLATRCSYYDQAAEYIAKMYYGPFYFSFAPANVSVKGIGGPGLTIPLPAVAVTPTIPWEDVYYNPSSS
jgi:peptide/nickel transport system substrate-binding protein